MISKYEESLRNLINIQEANPGLINLAYTYGAYIAMGYDVCDIQKYFTSMKCETPIGTKVYFLSNSAKRKSVSDEIVSALNYDMKEYVDNLKLTNTDTFYTRNIEQALGKYKGNLRACFTILLKQNKANENVKANISKLTNSNISQIQTIGKLLDSSLEQVVSNNIEEKTILDFDANNYDKFIDSVRPSLSTDKYVCMLGNSPATVGGKSLQEAKDNAKETYIKLDTNKHYRQAGVSKEKDSAPVKNF